ncbi:hypothetical protein SNL152K_1824 [Streptomyces sp. NL15-2K]|nr:hypothetical protein SNL152K_1824 [Streptomyces sp. NL15-2K]
MSHGEPVCGRGTALTSGFPAARPGEGPVWRRTGTARAGVHAWA